MNWTPIATPPPSDGWYLVTWGFDGSRSYVEVSEYATGFGFSDRWGANSTPLAWMPVPEVYRPE